MFYRVNIPVMKSIVLFLFLSLPLFSAETIALFDGKTLTGWVSDVPEADKKPDLTASFIVRDGKLVSLGKPLGRQ